MADNFVRKTVLKTTKLPKLDFYELGDFVLTNNGNLHHCAYYGGKKSFIQLLNAGHLQVLNRDINDLKTRVSTLETKVADHETRIKVLEATP